MSPSTSLPGLPEPPKHPQRVHSRETPLCNPGAPLSPAPAPRSCQQRVCPARAGRLRGTKSGTGTRVESKDEGLLLPGAQRPHQRDGAQPAPCHRNRGCGPQGSRGRRASCWAAHCPAQIRGLRIPRRGVCYLCRQPALWPRCTRASKRLLRENSSLTLKKSECLRGSLRILSLTSGVGGERMPWPVPPQLPAAEGSNTRVGRGSEAGQMGPLRETRLEPGADPALLLGNPRPVFTQKGGAGWFPRPFRLPQPPADGPPIRSQGGLGGHLPRSQATW